MTIEDRGFASMNPERQRELASKGGRAAHAKGVAHEWTSEEAREAGRKGGRAQGRKRREYLGQEHVASLTEPPPDALGLELPQGRDSE